MRTARLICGLVAIALFSTGCFLEDLISPENPPEVVEIVIELPEFDLFGETIDIPDQVLEIEVPDLPWD